MFHLRSRCGDRDEPSPKRIKTEVREQSHQLHEQSKEFYFDLSSFIDMSRVLTQKKVACMLGWRKIK